MNQKIVKNSNFALFSAELENLIAQGWRVMAIKLEDSRYSRTNWALGAYGL